jgi:hypothetical protein
MNGERLVDDYLERLDAAARPLPVTRRRELVDDVREHITEDLARGDRHDEIDVRNVLERLGPPDAIVAVELDAARVGAGESAMLLRADRGLGVGEVLAVLLLTVGAVVAPVVGPAVGLVLTWASSRWSVRTKAAITLVACVVLVVPIVLLAAMSASVGPTP